MDDHELLRKKEDEAVDNLTSLIRRFRTLEKPARKILLRKYPPERVIDAEGKKAVITISGLRYHNLVQAYEITGLTIRDVAPMEGYDTWLSVPVDMAVTILKKVLSGQRGALDEAFGDNRVKIRGKRVYHDMCAFEEVMDTLAENIRRFRELTS